jgi:hypothetical protein
MPTSALWLVWPEPGRWLVALCDLRLGDHVTAVVRGIEISGVVVEVGVFALVAGSGYRWSTKHGGGLVADPEGHVPVSKHTELRTVDAPRNQAELEEWLDRPLIPCSRRCH